MNSPKTKKTLYDLTFTDYSEHPIWATYDEDDVVIPLQYPGWSAEVKGRFTLHVACTYILHDGTQVPGVVNLHYDNKTPYAFSFPREDGILADFGVNSVLEDDAAREALARFFGKTIDQVFPMTYTTPFILESGRLLAGKHD